MNQKPPTTTHAAQTESTDGLNCTVCVMGVSGCGKSTVAAMIADHFSVPFCEADDFHPESNIKKMAAGVPLDDSDRIPWLQAVREEIKRIRGRDAKGYSRGCVVACSALKQSYRDRLSGEELETVFVHLAGSFEKIYERIQQRSSHFMPASLLRSQFTALEPPQPGPTAIELSIDHPAETLTAQAVEWLAKRSKLDGHT